MNHNLILKVILASTRPGRKGSAVANWIMDILISYPEVEIELLDLLEIDLPFLDEAAHPRLGQYRNEHTLYWSEKIDSADGFIIVTAEYNHVAPPTLQNALNFLHHEWSEKPVGFVSYGGVSGGTRAMDSLAATLTTLGMMPLPHAVNVPFFSQYIDEKNVFRPGDIQIKAAHQMIHHLMRWARALKQMRESK